MNKRKRKKEILKMVIKFYLDNGDFSIKLSDNARKKVARKLISYLKYKSHSIDFFLGSPLSKPVGTLYV